MNDPIANTDQQREHAKRKAQVTAAFFCELVKQGVPECEAVWLSRDYLIEAVIEHEEEG